jgi:hypothetical protein
MQFSEEPVRGSTFIAALLATLFILAKPVLWGAFIFALALLMAAEPV